MSEDVSENGQDSGIRFREDEEMEFFTELALHEVERWIQSVTRKKFDHPDDFRKSLANGVLLCELLNNLKPGSVKRINKLGGPIAGLDNLNVFLNSCEKNFGLNRTHLFDPNDLEDLSQRAIADENESLLKQEVDRRARNVAVGVYWLGKAVADTYSGPALDTSAFSAIVHIHGGKNIISNEHGRNDSWVTPGSPVKTDVSLQKHTRDSSYDSLGSYEHCSESSFDDLEASQGSMPVRDNMKGDRRYNSTNSLNMNQGGGGLRLSANSDNNYEDSMYVSSPDLSQGSHPHARSWSTDESLDGSNSNYGGSHSRQTSGSSDNYQPRLSGSQRKTSTSAVVDPLQFIKPKSADELARIAQKQMQITQEVNKMRGKVETGSLSEEPDWQSNFSNWKNKRRKSASEKSFHLGEDMGLWEEDEPAQKVVPRKTKTFGQIMAEKNKRRSMPLPHYPLEDDDSGIGFTRSSLEDKVESTPKDKKSKGESVAPWARDSSGEADSQSDSETNNSHQSGDTDSVFSDKSTPSKVLSDDDTYKSKVTYPTNSEKITPTPVRPLRQAQGSAMAWEKNILDNQKKDEKKKVDIPLNNSAKKLKNVFEEKEKEAHAQPVIERRRTPKKYDTSKSFDYSSSGLSNTSQSWKSLDLTDRSTPKRSSLSDKSLSPTSPNALLPKGQRFHSQPVNDVAKDNKKFTEKNIKINQKPNNSRGFGFTLVGGAEKRQPVTVQRVSLGSAADVCEVEANDELLSVNGRDVTTLTLAQVQGIVDHSVKKGQIELRIKRYFEEGDELDDSFELSPAPRMEPQSNNINNSYTPGPVQGHHNTYAYEQTMQMSATQPDGPVRRGIMDNLTNDNHREANNNLDKYSDKDYNRAPSPVAAETIQADVSFSAQSAPRTHDMALRQNSIPARDMGRPDDEIVTVETPTISVKRNTQSEESPVQMRRSRTPVKQTEPEVTKVMTSPAPPTPPAAGPPSLVISTNDDEDNGFGPPAALMKWQQKRSQQRSKSEYKSPYEALRSEEKSKASKRLSSTLPYNSDFKLSDYENYSKDDSVLDRVSSDFEATVSISKPVSSKPSPYQFDDASKIESWQQQQDRQIKPEPFNPPIEVNIQSEENLTAQEKFERDQLRIRQQYEEEKKRAQEAEKQKQLQEKQVLKSDKLLQSMESQIQQTKHEAANQQLRDIQPIRPAPTEPRFQSEPMTIRIPSNVPGRPLMIDPRNQADPNDHKGPEYSFHVNLAQTDSKPPLRNLDHKPELSQEELLQQEREKIREEEKRKFEEERLQWKKQQEQELHQQQEILRLERERLQREKEQVEQEKAILEQQKHHEEVVTSRYQSVNNHVYSPHTSTGSASSLSSSPRSPPSALSPKYRQESPSRKPGPPATAPKPEKKGRLTREDLLAMNRKATPLTAKPEGQEGETGNLDNSNSMREAPSKGQLHSLNAVPKPKFRSSAAWIKDDEVPSAPSVNEKPFVIGKRSDIIHQKDYSNPQDHWLVREAEKRRLADQASVNITAHAGPTKPSQSSLVSKFRGDIEPPVKNNRYPSSQIGSDIRLSSGVTRPLSSSGTSLRQYDRSPDTGSTQFSPKTQANSYASPSLSNTLPADFSFNANSSTRQRALSPSVPSKLPRSPGEDASQVTAVSGKQKCSHCGEELGFGAAMVIESLGLYYHVQCFCCCVCRMPLGNGSEGADVRVRVNKLHCRNCYSNDEAGLKFSKV